MKFDAAHPSSTSSPASATVPSTAIHNNDMDDDMSDSDLSQFEAEIEKELSSSPESGTLNGANGHASDDAMEVDSEDDVRPSHAGKGRRQGSTKEYMDPDLYLLRRSVCYPGCCCRWIGLIQLGTCKSGTREICQCM